MLPDPTTRLTRTGLNLIQQAISMFDSDLRLTVSNQRFQEMFDFPEALVSPGASFEAIIRFLVERGEYGPQSDPESAIRQRVETARDFEPHYMERQRANGRWVSVEGAPLPDGGWVAVYTDITEIKLQERLLRARSAELSDQLLAHAERLSLANRALAATNAALAEAKREITEIEARTRFITEMTPAHIAHIDPDMAYTYSNMKLSAVMPGSPANVVGIRASEALDPETYARIAPSMERALAGEPSVSEITHALSGRRIRVALTPDFGPPGRSGSDGAPVGAFILSTDITDEVQARAALTQTRRRELAAQLTSGLAHDFANLLTIILGLQGKLARLEALPEEAAALVGATLGAARRGGALLQRLGGMSGHKELRLEPTMLEPLLDDISMMARPSLPEGIRLRLEIEPGLGSLMLDPGAVQDCVLNLILNARDALRPREAAGEAEPRSIRLVVRRLRDTWLEIGVEDDGPGFTEEALLRGLDPFFTTKGSEGSGLGLAMVFDHASLAGGSVRLANRPEGGARVTLRLPFRPAPGAAGKLVLLVEDSPEIRTHAREMLVTLGYSVIEAGTAAEARALLGFEGLGPEALGLVLSDLHLAGGETGLTLLDDLARSSPALATGLMTSMPPSDALHREAASRHPVLRKPFGPAELSGFLARAAARCAPGPEQAEEGKRRQPEAADGSAA